MVDVHVLSETAARRLGEAKPRLAVNGQDLAFEGGSFRVRAVPILKGQCAYCTSH